MSHWPCFRRIKGFPTHFRFKLFIQPLPFQHVFATVHTCRCMSRFFFGFFFFFFFFFLLILTLQVSDIARLLDPR
jgi:hypothetical protein